MLFDTADDRMCDYEALERDYYDTEYLKPKYLDITGKSSPRKTPPMRQLKRSSTQATPSY